jgi:hypothetical protein
MGFPKLAYELSSQQQGLWNYFSFTKTTICNCLLSMLCTPHLCCVKLHPCPPDRIDLFEQKGGQGVTICVKRKVDNAKLVLKQTQCENVKAGNDALREAKMLQVTGSNPACIVVYTCKFCSQDGFPATGSASYQCGSIP